MLLYGPQNSSNTNRFLTRWSGSVWCVCSCELLLRAVVSSRSELATSTLQDCQSNVISYERLWGQLQQLDNIFFDSFIPEFATPVHTPAGPANTSTRHTPPKRGRCSATVSCYYVPLLLRAAGLREDDAAQGWEDLMLARGPNRIDTTMVWPRTWSLQNKGVLTSGMRRKTCSATRAAAGEPAKERCRLGARTGTDFNAQNAASPPAPGKSANIAEESRFTCDSDKNRNLGSAPPAVRAT